MSRFYQYILKPVLFRFDPEKIHHFSTELAERPIIADAIRKIRPLPEDQISLLNQQLGDLTFTNPLGLAAGFDKNARLHEFCDALGFGYREVGSITAKPSPGNPKPRLFRIPDDQGLVNRMGLNNDGVDIISLRVSESRDFPAVNIAKTHDPAIQGKQAVEDYVYSFRKLAQVSRYITLNISCPNTEEGKTFETPESLRELLSAIQRERNDSTPPVFIKFSADLAESEVFELLQIAEDHDINGYVCCNTSTDRTSLQTNAGLLQNIGNGGISGRPVHQKSCRMLKFIRQHIGESGILIGVGGIDSFETAKASLASGADLLQLYTGLVYKGPGLVREILNSFILEMEQYGMSSFREYISYLRQNQLFPEKNRPGN